MPSFTTLLEGAGTSTPNSGFLSGATTGQNKTTTGRVLSNVGIVPADTVGWQLQRRLGQHALDNDECLLELLATAAVVAVHRHPSAAAAQFQHRQSAPAGHSQREGPRYFRFPAAADDRDHLARRAQCLLGSRVSRTPRSWSSSSRSILPTSRCARRTRAFRSARHRRLTPSRRRRRSQRGSRR